jgi:spermidine synthase
MAAAFIVESEQNQPVPISSERWILVISIFAAGMCSIVYELLIGTASSYFLGDSIQQFSITIGVFMASMGLGSFLSRKLDTNLYAVFVKVELALGVLGGFSIPFLYYVFAYTDVYSIAMLGMIVAIGALTGLEIPILVLMLRQRAELKTNLSNILSLDYLGALAATLLFPFVFLPIFGTFRTALLTGLLNLLVAGLFLWRVQAEELVAVRRSLAKWIAVASVALAVSFVFAPYWLRPWHHAVFEDRVVLVRQTPYQKIVITHSRGDVRLFLNSNLQFSSWDEHRYHEALVHPIMALAPEKKTVLVLGGGDGLAVRELLKYKETSEITLVDLDPAMTALASEHPMLRKINQDSFRSPKVHVVHADAFTYLQKSKQLFDIIIADLPDPNNTGLARLYSVEFYKLIHHTLARSGLLVTQATSPYFAKKAFWCIDRTLQKVGFQTFPYHAYVPSFGDWGFVLAARTHLVPEDAKLAVPTRFLDQASMRQLFVFAKDVRDPSTTISTLDHPQILTDYLKGWKRWE